MLKIEIHSKYYLKQLLKIKNPPKQLYIEGNIEILNKLSIAIIGSRNCSANGAKLAEKFGQEIAGQGLCVVSGMAKGIDAYAHKGALQINGKTIAVLGTGLDNIFPKENKELYYKIIENDGAVITEYPPKTEIKSKQFLERNRIVSGLSLGILVVEAAYRSGTSVTARIAKEQNRKVFVLPHEIDNSHGVGSNKLIQKGAILTTSTKDIIEQFECLEYKENVFMKNNKTITNFKFSSQEEKEIYNLIKSNKKYIEDIYKNTKIPINKINESILILEIKGYIQKTKGGYICI